VLQARDALLDATHVLVTIAPMRDERGGDGVLRWHREDLLSMSDLRWLGYLSSTGVYGDFQGAWVTEADAPRPNTPVGEARHRAELEWGALSSLPLHIFRLAGIYGPGRSAIDTLRKNDNDLQACGVTAGDPSYISRVHVADISQAVGLSMLQPQRGGALYNLADDRPASRFEVFSHARGLLTGEPASDEAATVAVVQVSCGLQHHQAVHERGRACGGASPGERIDSMLSWSEAFPCTGYKQDGGETVLSVPGSRRRQAGNKRVSNSKLRSELLAPAGMDLVYPDYMAGLRQIVEESG
jgi:hypothetical protein